jgi:hypothetical protein
MMCAEAKSAARHNYAMPGSRSVIIVNGAVMVRRFCHIEVRCHKGPTKKTKSVRRFGVH